MEINDTTYVGVSQNTTGATLLVNGKMFAIESYSTPQFFKETTHDFGNVGKVVLSGDLKQIEIEKSWIINVTEKYLINSALFWGVSKKRVYAQFVAYHKKKYIIQRLKRNYK